MKLKSYENPADYWINEVTTGNRMAGSVKLLYYIIFKYSKNTNRKKLNEVIIEYDDLFLRSSDV